MSEDNNDFASETGFEVCRDVSWKTEVSGDNAADDDSSADVGYSNTDEFMYM